MTNMTKGGEAVVLKTDTSGRVRMSAVQHERVLDEFERSGLSGAKFAKLAGVKYQTFATWARRRGRQREAEAGKVPTTPAEPVKWLEAVDGEVPNSGSKTGHAVVLRWPGGASVELHHSGQISMAAALVRALAQPC